MVNEHEGIDPHCWCLSPPEASWRRRRVEPRFREEGLVVEFFDAFHGPTLGLVPRLSRPHESAVAPVMGPGRVGLWLSYMTLWHLMQVRPEQSFLVFEDDVILVSGFMEKLRTAIAALPSDWDVVSVGSCQIDGKIGYPLCNHALLWRKSGAARALSLLRPWAINEHLDVALARLVYPKSRHVTLDPPLCFQEHYADATRSLMPPAWWDSIPGWSDFLPVYDEQLNRVRGRKAVFVEVGSWLGRSAAYMGEQIKRRQQEVEFWAVDTWKGTPGHVGLQAVVDAHGGDVFPAWHRNLSAAGSIGHVKPLRKPSVEAAETFANGSLDFVFIDADHSYAAVCADIAAWSPKLRPDGVLAGHDYDNSNVQRAVRDSLPGRFRVFEHTWIVDDGAKAL